MGETLEYLEALADNEDWEELENCGESPYDWGKMPDENILNWGKMQNEMKRKHESAEDINKENKNN